MITVALIPAPQPQPQHSHSHSRSRHLNTHTHTHDSNIMVNVIIREVASNVWTFSTPFTRLGVFRIGGRSTAIKLASGAVWVLASTPLTDETKAAIDRLGPVKFVVGPNAVHHLFLAEFHKAYPNAMLLTVEEVVKKKKDWSDSNRDPTFDFDDEIRSCYFTGFRNKDVAFFHSRSKTLIAADLIFNLPPTEQYSETRSGRGLCGCAKLTPYTSIHHALTRALVVNPAAMRRDVKSVANWDFHRIIPCHGNIIEVNGKKVWRAAYNTYLD
ncbi:hypothetical protein B0F90DRAFT_1164560 [Multifurca ochricompacta]|uniref:DUF4336 domain-containing protein n=1 Tax=Multifurca ochricompacta TaxID=376703 RepID=A0AAD4M7G5_9AGAM|nr:hypothetical protein B0F90DRAFT_1164560 [Multifurca ochricompacta]